ncbi:MAG: glycosyltransferase family 4 protein [Anaerolineales bacterium]
MPTKPRVIQILHGFSIEGAGGGANRFGIELAKALNPDKFQRAVWALWDFGTQEERVRRMELEKQGLETFVGAPWVESQPYQGWWQAYRAFARQLKQTPAQILNSHSEFGDVPVVLFKLANPRLKVVRTAHGGHIREWHRRPIRRTLLTNFLYPLFYDVEIGVGPRVIQELNQRLLAKVRKKEALFLANAINLDRFSQVNVDIAEKRRSLNIPKGSFLIGSVGRLAEQKGYTYLIEAAKTVIEQKPESFFLLIGAGPLAEVLQEQAKQADLSERVIFAGMRPDVEAWYACLDLFVSSSLWEGLSTVIMESMATGTPIVATDILGSRELIQHGKNGWLVPPARADELAKGILDAIHNPGLRESFALQAKEDVRSHSICSVAGKYVAIYESLLAK